MFIDTHAHLFFSNFDSDLEQVIENALNAGVTKIIVPGTSIETSNQSISLADKFECIYSTVGIHPHDTAAWTPDLIYELEKLTKHPKVVGVGEIGLDYYYDFSPKEKQIAAFKEQIALALEKDLPVIIHNRDANEDVMEIIADYDGRGLRGQFHCFAGSIKDAGYLAEKGYYISFPGNVTFVKAENLRNVLKSVNIKNLLLETDSPFMTPVPHRGKRNEPAYLPLIAEKIAEVHNLSIEEVAKATSENSYNLFGIREKSDNLTYTYRIGNNLYINVTNRCNADCVFCDRKGEAVIRGYNLKMKKSEEPEASEYIKEIGDPSKYDEIVFCGYGEPTIRWEVVKKISRFVKNNGGRTRINTDGHGSVINKRDITPEMKELIDTVSISLNSTDPKQYAKLMRVDPKMHAEMIDFAKRSKKYAEVVMSIVGLSEVDTQKAKKFVTEEVGVNFRQREYF